MVKDYSLKLKKLRDVYKKESRYLMSKVEKKVADLNNVNDLSEASEHSLWFEEELGDLVHKYNLEIFVVDDVVYVKEEGQLFIPVKLLVIDGRTVEDIIYTELSEDETTTLNQWLKLLRGLIYTIVGDYELIDDKDIEQVYKELYLLYSTTTRR